ncbi:hypothetical protein LTR53_012958, partial [Teratosphaeriaceae sp. CCFEE 6253]
MHRLPRAFRLRQQPPASLLRPTTPKRHLSLIPRRRHQLPTHLYRPNGEPIRYRAVRFASPPFFTWRRAATVGIYTGVAYLYASLILRYLEIEIEVLDDDDEADHQHDPQEVAEQTEDEKNGIFYADPDSTFIPLTWSTLLPRQFYKGSDPEWKAFVSLAKDKPRQKKVNNELVALVFTGSTKHPALKRQLGADPKVGKYWLDMAFPDAPPPEYYRSGLEVGEGFIAWSRQRVSQESQFRASRALWPRAAAEGFWGAGRVLAGIQYRRVKQALGWEAKDPQAPEERYRMAVEMMEKRKLRGKEGQQG